MKQLKEYDNLEQIYEHGIRKYKVCFWIFLLLFIAAIGTFLIDGFPFEFSMLLLFMIFPALMFGVIWLVMSLRTQKQLKPFSPGQLKMINEESRMTAEFDGFQITSQAVLHKTMGLELVPMKTLLWVYTDVTVTKLEGMVPIHKDTVVIFAGTDKKKYGFRIKNNQRVMPFLVSELLKYRQDLVFGNEYGLENIYKNDMNRMIRFAQECAEKRKEEIEQHEL